MKSLKENFPTCEKCGKNIAIANNRPHSLHRTKRIVKANIQKNHGLVLCTRCLRTQSKNV